MARISRLDNRSTYEVRTEEARYAVTLTRLKNDVNGNPKFEANIILLEMNGIKYCEYFLTACYRFAGHFLSEKDEAKWVVQPSDNDEEEKRK